ncbi:cystathionine gamma-synthase [Vibrio sp. 10N.286.49.B3]|uniref:cytochrome c-type biogenesis protein n=1 Tax=Vibrio sp. 10N.286.49.B3 TaxID=1880855 RepID=UPI000C855BDD|nr:cytochrome c-type biogenesis protein [Vibrio sp. 10N.286.49.B3]PMH41009.1 cystathionine gamma-synthase [Vibrio sp. 10N.286.49.B3]
MKKWLLALLCCSAFSLATHAAIEIHTFDNTEQELQFQELNKTLRCPKCQNNTIGDSNAELAQDLRQKVYEMTKEGKSKSEIIDYMIARYGNFVTYNPPLTPATAILWFGPIGVIVFGFSLIILRSRRGKSQQEDAKQDDDWNEEKESRLNALLDEQKSGDKS